MQVHALRLATATPNDAVAEFPFRQHAPPYACHTGRTPAQRRNGHECGHERAQTDAKERKGTQTHPRETSDSAKGCKKTQTGAKTRTELQSRYSPVRFRPAPLCGVMTYGLRCIGVPSLRLQDRYSTALIRSAYAYEDAIQFVACRRVGAKYLVTGEDYGVKRAPVGGSDAFPSG
jgi:hypothetical protein